MRLPSLQTDQGWPRQASWLGSNMLPTGSGADGPAITAAAMLAALFEREGPEGVVALFAAIIAALTRNARLHRADVNLRTPAPGRKIREPPNSATRWLHIRGYRLSQGRESV